MPESDDTLLKKPIIVIGAPRSGTSMLMRILNRHPNLALLHEPRLTWRYGNDNKSDQLGPQHARPDVCRHIRRTFAQAVRREGKQRLAEKTPANALRLGFVDQVFPDCKFIHTIRNGQDSILAIREKWMHKTHGVGAAKLMDRIKEMKLRQAPSYARELLRRLMPRRMTGPNLWGPRIAGIEAMRRELDVVDICCLQWRTCVEAACHYGRQLPHDRYMEYHIEQMSPQRLDAVIDFCELDNSRAMRDYFAEHYDPKHPGRRKKQADPADVQRIRQWIEPTLQWLGYA